MTDELNDPVQPDSGQGAGVDGSPYADYLNRIPEELRSQVEPVFRDWDANTTRKFQEHSEFRKQFEPYAPLGLTELPPDDVAWALQFRQAAVTNPQAIADWYQEYAANNGLASSSSPAPQAPQGDPYSTPEYEDPAIAAMKQQLAPLQEQLQAINSWREQQEQQARYAEAQRTVESQLHDLEQKHPDEFNRDAIERLCAQYIDTDPQHAVPRAFADWQAIRNQLEKNVIQAKVNAPPPAESGGVAHAAPEEYKTLKDAGAAAMEFLRQSRAT